MYGFGLGNL